MNIVPMTIGDHQYMNEEQAMAFLGRKRNFFRSQRKQGRLPMYKLGRNNLYRQDDLINLITIQK